MCSLDYISLLSLPLLSSPLVLWLSRTYTHSTSSVCACNGKLEDTNRILRYTLRNIA